VTPRVDFYVLESSTDRARLVYACRLIEKAFLREQTVFVRTDSAAEANEFDELLWTFADRSFIPHALSGGGGTEPVTIGSGEALPAQLLINLGTEAPSTFALYPRIAEFVDADPLRRDRGRRRFAFYRERGLKPETHSVPG
jgi:DNA polymerase-3 subunit chi